MRCEDLNRVVTTDGIRPPRKAVVSGVWRRQLLIDDVVDYLANPVVKQVQLTGGQASYLALACDRCERSNVWKHVFNRRCCILILSQVLANPTKRDAEPISVVQPFSNDCSQFFDGGNQRAASSSFIARNANRHRAPSPEQNADGLFVDSEALVQNVDVSGGIVFEGCHFLSNGIGRCAFVGICRAKLPCGYRLSARRVLVQ